MGYGFCDGAVAYSMYVGNLKCFGIQGLRGPGIQGDPLCGSRFAEATPGVGNSQQSTTYHGITLSHASTAVGLSVELVELLATLQLTRM